MQSPIYMVTTLLSTSHQDMQKLCSHVVRGLEWICICIRNHTNLWHDYTKYSKDKNKHHHH